MSIRDLIQDYQICVFIIFITRNIHRYSSLAWLLNFQPQRIILHIHASGQNRALVIRRVDRQAEHDLVPARDEEELWVEGEFVCDVVAAYSGSYGAGTAVVVAIFPISISTCPKGGNCVI